MKHTNTYSHLTLEERRIILNGISHGSTKTAIAQTIGKDKSTVGKEIKAPHPCEEMLVASGMLRLQKVPFPQTLHFGLPGVYALPLLPARPLPRCLQWLPKPQQVPVRQV